MINIKTLKGKSAAGVVGYVEKNQERGEAIHYYQEGGKAPSEWQGRGAEMLGLSSGSIDAKVFKELLEKGPEGMEVGENRRMGVDLTWSAPKSVSMLIESAGPEMRERLLDLCKEANSVAMQHIEDHVVSARYGKGGAISQKTGTALIASFQHDDARPTPDENGSMKIDPDTHFHNIFVNATHDGSGWRAMDLDFGALSVEQHLADFKAKAHLAAGLEKMGVSTEKTRDGFEVAGISRDQIMAFSDRSKEIEKALSEKGLTRETSTAAERNVANLDTRKNKLRDLSQVELRYQWRERLRAAGVDFQQLYDPQRDQSINTEQLLPSSTTEKEQHNEQQQFFKHIPDDQFYPDHIESRSGDRMQSLSSSGMDAGERGEDSSLLPDHAQVDRSTDHALRREPAAGDGLTEAKARQAIDAALDHLSEKDSLFDKRQLALEAIKQGMGEVSGVDIEAAMGGHGRIVWAGEQTKEVEQARMGKDGKEHVKKTQIRAEMVTTVETVAREGWIQGFCAEGRGKLAPLMSQEDAEKSVQAAEKSQGFSFATDQSQAVIATLTSEDRVHGQNHGDEVDGGGRARDGLRNRRPHPKPRRTARIA